MCCLIVLRPRPYNERPLTKWFRHKYPHLFEDHENILDPKPLPYPMPVTNMPMPLTNMPMPPTNVTMPVTNMPIPGNGSAPPYAPSGPCYQFK